MTDQELGTVVVGADGLITAFEPFRALCCELARGGAGVQETAWSTRTLDPEPFGGELRVGPFVTW